jgi:octaprenyl-diphosphate synthase
MLNPATHNVRKPNMAELAQSLLGDDLEEAERILHRALSPYHARFAPFGRHLRHYRGKRLRPTLLLLIARASGKVVPAHRTLAAVVEMIHTATLVHDDVLDEASARRHVRTVNSLWGNKASILLGDLLFTNAFHLSSTIGDARACEWIGEATNRVCAGELLQTAERGNLKLTEEEYFWIIEGKTAALTECCGRLGAFYAGASPELVESLAGFGRDLGISFQIADDILDLVGNERTAGKTLGTDLQQRKLTLPLIYLFERVSAAEAEAFRLALLEQNASFDDLRHALRETGAIESAQVQAEAFAERAREALGGLPDSPSRSMLESMAGWAARREA